MSGIGYDEAEGIGQDEAEDRWERPLRGAAEASPFGGPRSPEPSTLTIFGVTGDLAHRKLIPALYDLACHGVLPPEFTIVGYGRQPLDDDSFRELMLTAIDDHYGQDDVDGESCERILRAPRYVQGQFDDPEGYRRLAATLDELDRDGGTRGNRMFYLATPPTQFPVIVEQLGEAGLARRGAFDAAHALGEPVPGWTRLVVEKPFGRDLASAEALNGIIGARLRRAPGVPHRPLPRQGDGAEPPGPALRQRHLRAGLEPALRRPRADHRRRDARASSTAAPTTRRPAPCATWSSRTSSSCSRSSPWSRRSPSTPTPCATRSSRCCARCGRSRRTASTCSRSAVSTSRESSTGEEAVAYRAEERVAPDSTTETFAAVKLLVDNWRWQGVPFYLRTGKRMAKKVTEIAIQFRRPPVMLFRQAVGAPAANVLVLRACSPTRASRCASSPRSPGQGLALQQVAMDYSYGGTLKELPFSAYETVLVDAMEGDMTLFKRGDQVEQAWRLMEPILEAWKTAAAPRPADLRGRQLGAGGGRRPRRPGRARLAPAMTPAPCGSA